MPEAWELWRCTALSPGVMGGEETLCNRWVYLPPGGPAPTCTLHRREMESIGAFEMEVA